MNVYATISRDCNSNIVVSSISINEKFPILTLTEYIKNPPNLAKMKIPELKSIAKYNKLHVTGTKPVLIQRINGYYISCILAIKIQKIIRGYFTRLSFKLRGIGFKNRTICTNTTDFLTMDPLDEIPHSRFYSYTDERQFTYGFDLNSLISIYKKKGKIVNPYNREKISLSTLHAILKLYRLIGFIYKDYEYELDTPPPPIISTNIQPVFLNNVPSRTNTLTQTILRPYGVAAQVNLPIIDLSNNILVQSNRMTDVQLSDIRSRSVNDRVIAVFMDMDQLGHYTNNVWFQELDKRQYYNFFREIYNIWRFRAQLSYFTKFRICPFDPTDVFGTIIYDDMTIENMREGCLRIVENMVYMGIDTDHRNLGTFHILSALTVVSPPARQALPWLYESVR
jgi:hypothetical protein